MSGGVAYVWDVNKNFVKNCNMEMVLLDTLDEEDEKLLRHMIESHQKLTHSELAAHLLSYWPTAYKNFIKVMPIDYKAALEKRNGEKKTTVLKPSLGNKDFKYSSN
jgi:glutamate synthase (NADPH) large chain